MNGTVRFESFFPFVNLFVLYIYEYVDIFEFIGYQKWCFVFKFNMLRLRDTVDTTWAIDLEPTKDQNLEKKSRADSK